MGRYPGFDTGKRLSSDAPELVSRKAQTQADFEKGLKQFFNKEFPEAAATFNKVLKTNTNDRPARLFLNKSGEYLVGGVPDGWTGVEVMTFK